MTANWERRNATLPGVFRSKWFYALLVVPCLLIGSLFWVSSRRPQSLIGTTAPEPLIGGITGGGMPFNQPFLEAGRMPRMATVVGLPGPATALAYAPDGTLICSADGLIFKWDAAKKKWRQFGRPVLSELIVPGASMGGQEPKTRLLSSADGRRLLVPEDGDFSGGSDNTAIYDLKNRQFVGALRQTGPSGIALSKDGRWAACAEMNLIALFDLRALPLDKRLGINWYQFENRRRAVSFFVFSAPPTALAFSPDSRFLAVGLNGHIALFDVADKIQKMRLQCDLQGQMVPVEGQYQGRTADRMGVAPVANPLRLEWSRDGSQLAALSGDEVAIFDPNLRKIAGAKLPAPRLASPGATPPPPPGNGAFSVARPFVDAPGLAWTPDSQTLFTTGDEVRRFRARDLNLERSYGLNGPIAVSPDGHWLMTRNKPKAGEPLGLLKWDIR